MTEIKGQKKTAGNKLMSLLIRRNDISVVIATSLLFLFFSIATESFLSSYNLFNVGRTASLYLFVAIGQVFALVVGGMNLSLGAIGGMSVVTAGYSMEVMGLPPWIAVIFALVVGLLAGLLNGYIIVKFKLNSFVVTLASSFVFTGLVFGISKGFPYTKIPKSFSNLGRGSFLEVPYLFWLMIIVLVAMWYVFKYTVIGRKILATGGNIQAARLSGINTNRIILLCNALSGLFAALAGVLWISRMGSAPPGTGQDWLISSFAVAVIGGTALSGGQLTALGLFASAILIALIKNGLIMMQVNVYYEQTFLGLIIFLAVFVESLRIKYNSMRKL